MFEINPIVFTLSNGLRVVYAKRESFVAHMGVLMRAGSRYETSEEEGLAHFVEHTIFKGSKNRTSEEIFSGIDAVGGELNAYTNKEEMCLHASFRKVYFERAAELLADIIQNPIFPEDEITKEKNVILDEINSYLDAPSERIQDEFEAHLFEGHSLGYNILGTEESLNKLGREDLLRFTKRHFTAQNTVIAIVGDIDLEEVRSILEAQFNTVPTLSTELNYTDFVNLPKQFNIVESKANYQTHLLLGGYAPVKTEVERKAMTLLMNYLGGPALNAKLVLNIREKYGYAYNIEANYTPYNDVGFWSIYAGTDSKYLEKTKELIQQELDELKKGLSAEDLDGAKEQLKGHIALSLDSNLELMFYLAKNLLFHERIDSVKDIYHQVDMLSMEQLQVVIDSLFKDDNINYLTYSLRD